MPPVSRRTSTGIRRPRVAGRTTPGARDPQATTEVLEPPTVAAPKRGSKPRSGKDRKASAEAGDTVVAETDTEVVDTESGEAPTVDAESPAARPRGRRAKVSLRKPGAEAESKPEKAARKPRHSLAALFAAPTSKRAIAVYSVLALLLAGAAAFFGMSWYNQEFTGSAANHALIDVGGTAQVSQQVGDDLKTVYSFDYTRLDENEKNARAVITPEFEQQFDGIFADVRARAPQQKAVVTATIAMSSVRSLEGDTAVLVVFMDQLATRTADNAGQQQLASAGRLTVTAKLVDGHWKIADVKAV